LDFHLAVGHIQGVPPPPPLLWAMALRKAAWRAHAMMLRPFRCRSRAPAWAPIPQSRHHRLEYHQCRRDDSRSGAAARGVAKLHERSPAGGALHSSAEVVRGIPTPAGVAPAPPPSLMRWIAWVQPTSDPERRAFNPFKMMPGDAFEV
jgi:hypothetical protein